MDVMDKQQMLHMFMTTNLQSPNAQGWGFPKAESGERELTRGQPKSDCGSHAILPIDHSIPRSSMQNDPISLLQDTE